MHSKGSEQRTLGQVVDLLRSGPEKDTYVHVYGTFISEFKTNGGSYWTLQDETAELTLKLLGSAEDYATYSPRPGDTVRIHRLKVAKGLANAEIAKARNVVVWPAFEHEPAPITTARQATLNETDNARRQELETYYITRINTLLSIKNDRLANGSGKQFYNVRGRVERASIDIFGHLIINFTDKTETLSLRVFCPKKPTDVDAHFKLASSLKEGHYFVATYVYSDQTPKTFERRLNLSANLSDGRSIRLVNPNSILGLSLSEALNPKCPDNQPRCSSRLPQKEQDENCQQDQPDEPMAEIVSEEPNPPMHNVALPKYTLHCDIRKSTHGYEYYDIVGVVMAEPRKTTKYDHCVIEIFDGSYHEFVNYYAFEVELVKPGSLIVQIYSKQKDTDTDEHYKKAMALRVGDLVHITNIKISFPNGLIKPELNSNTSHQKSINVIDRQTPFGIKILNLVENPSYSELTRNIVEALEANAEVNPFQDP